MRTAVSLVRTAVSLVRTAASLVRTAVSLVRTAASLEGDREGRPYLRRLRSDSDPDPRSPIRGSSYTEMLLSPFAISSDPLDVAGLMALAQHDHDAIATAADREGPGAVVLFVGVVRGRHQGRRVAALEYEAYAPLAVAAFERIAREADTRLPGVIVRMHHRTGRLTVGEPSVAIAAAAAHRADACAASRFAIERIKQIAPIWKREELEDGVAWVEGAVADPDAADALADAWSRACV